MTYGSRTRNTVEPGPARPCIRHPYTSCETWVRHHCDRRAIAGGRVEEGEVGVRACHVVITKIAVRVSLAAPIIILIIVVVTIFVCRVFVGIEILEVRLDRDLILFNVVAVR
jgi:hypothetical protein